MHTLVRDWTDWMRSALLLVAAGLQFVAVQGMLAELGWDADWADYVWAMSLLTTAVSSVILAIQKR